VGIPQLELFYAALCTTVVHHSYVQYSLVNYDLLRFISWPVIVWGSAIVISALSVCLSHANISETKQDRHMVTRILK